MSFVTVMTIMEWTFVKIKREQSNKILSSTHVLSKDLNLSYN